MPNEKLTLEILTTASGQDSIDRMTQALNRFSAASEQANGRSAAMFKQSAAAADEATVSFRRLFLAGKDLFEGRGSFAAVEGGYFLQGLGAIGIGAGVAAVAIYGIVKASEEAAKSGEKFKAAFSGLDLSIRTSNDELRVSNDRLENEIAKLEGKPQNNLRLALDEAKAASDKLAESLDKTLGEAYKVFNDQGRGFWNSLFHGESSSNSTAKFLGGESGMGGLRARIAEASGDPEKSRQVLNQGLTELITRGAREQVAIQSGHNVLDSTRDLELIHAAERELQGQLDHIDETQRGQADQKKLDQVRSAKELSEAQKAERAKEQENLKAGMEESLGNLKRDHEVTNAEETTFWTKRLAEVDQFGGRYLQLHKDIINKLGDLAHTRNETNKRVAADLDSMSRESFDRIARQQEEADRQGGAFVESNANAGSRFEDLKSRGILDTRLAGLDAQRQAIQRASGLTPLGASQDEVLAARIAESQKLTEIDRQEGALRLAEETKLLNQISADDTEKRQEQANRVVELTRETNQKIYDDTTKTLDLIHDYQNKQLESFRSGVGSLFDAVTSRNPTALRDLVRSDLLGIGRTMTENVAQEFLFKPIQTATQNLHTSGTLGRLLQGTPFGPDPLKGATDANTAATIANTTAIARLSGFSGAGGTFGGGSSTNPFVFSGFGGGSASFPGDIGDGLPMASGPWGATSTVGYLGQASSFSKYAGAAAMGAAGALSAYQGFSRGGAGGALQGAGGIAGVAGAVLPLISSSLAMAGPIGAIAGLGLSLLGGLFNGPQARENSINKALAQNQYIAPVALNATMSSSGTFTDFDYKGGIRGSDLSPFPQVRQGSIWEQTHGLFGGPATFYNVPGGQTSQFGAPITNNYTTNNHISAMDGQDVARVLNKNVNAVGDVAAKAMQNGHGALTTEVQRAARG